MEVATINLLTAPTTPVILSRFTILRLPATTAPAYRTGTATALTGTIGVITFAAIRIMATAGTTAIVPNSGDKRWRCELTGSATIP